MMSGLPIRPRRQPTARKSDCHLNAASDKAESFNNGGVLAGEDVRQFLFVDPGAESYRQKFIRLVEYRGHDIVLGSKFRFRHGGRRGTPFDCRTHVLDSDEFDAASIDGDRWPVMTRQSQDVDVAHRGGSIRSAAHNSAERRT